MLLLPSLLLAALPQTSAPEDPGPHLVGWRDVVAQDTIFNQGNVRARLYYPAVSAGQDAAADPSAGPYVLTGFQHGWLGSPSDYDELCSHLASWGFVVASTGTETGLFPDKAKYARDTRSLLHWAEQQSGVAGSWLEGMVAPGTDWTVTGHSMGGGTLSLLIGIEPRVRTIIGLQAASMNATGNNNMRAFTGRAYWIAGSVDWIVPSGTVRAWYDRGDSAARNVFWEIQGMGHVGCTDLPAVGEPLSGPEQLRLHRRLVGGLLRAESRGEEDLFVWTLGQGFAGEPSLQQSRCIDPPLWARLGPAGTTVETGLAGHHGRGGVLAWSLVPGSSATIYGELGLSRNDLVLASQGRLDATGVLRLDLPVQPAWSGQTLYLQALALRPGGGAFSRTAALAIP